MSLFEVITKEEFEESGGACGSERKLSLPSETVVPSDQNLTYCEFCKGYYNEHHFGREVEDAH